MSSLLEKKADKLLMAADVDPETGLSKKGRDARVRRRGIRHDLIDSSEIDDLIPIRGIGGSICLCDGGSGCRDIAADFDPNLCTEIEHGLERD